MVYCPIPPIISCIHFHLVALLLVENDPAIIQRHCFNIIQLVTTQYKLYHGRKIHSEFLLLQK
jgi:hypothetical protein